jgi:hypothetical protein
MVRVFLVRGMLVGILAGLFCFGFLKVYGEPQVDRAIAFETKFADAKAAAEKKPAMDGAETESPELVSRPTQAGLGLFTAVMVYCTAFGGLFGLAFAFAQGRVPGAPAPQTLAALLAAIGFVTIYLVPSLKYPANPPSVGDAQTIGIRTALYFAMIAISLAAVVASVMLRRLLVPQFGAWNASLVAVAGYVAVAAIAAFVLPPVNEVPQQFPAVVLWQFRLASIGAQAIMWATIGLLFGALSERAFAERGLRA